MVVVLVVVVVVLWPSERLGLGEERMMDGTVSGVELCAVGSRRVLVSMVSSFW